MRALLLLILALLWASRLHGQAEWPKPNWENVERIGCRRAGKDVSFPVGVFHVRLVLVSAPKIGDATCRAYLVDRAGNQILLMEDWEVSIYQGTGEDVFGDGKPSLIRGLLRRRAPQLYVRDRQFGREASGPSRDRRRGAVFLLQRPSQRAVSNHDQRRSLRLLRRSAPHLHAASASGFGS